MNRHLHTRITYKLLAVSLEPLTALGIQWTFLVEYVKYLRETLLTWEKLGSGLHEGVQAMGEQKCGTAVRGGG